jgi:hypothetical protein
LYQAAFYESGGPQSSPRLVTISHPEGALPEVADGQSCRGLSRARRAGRRGAGALGHTAEGIGYHERHNTALSVEQWTEKTDAFTLIELASGLL